MINIVIPLAGKNQFFSEVEYIYPKPLIEINGKTMIEHTINNFKEIKEEKKFIFIINNDDCKKYHLDNVLKLLTNNRCKIIKINGETKGATCSVLMAIEEIDNDIPLIIANGDQVFTNNLEKNIFEFQDYDGGIISFNSVHPRWSYVKTNDINIIDEVSEKRPISNNAIAGLFYFKKGSDFVKSAMNMIKKDINISGSYYISLTLNEMILQNKKLIISKIENDKYHTFYTPQKIEEYKTYIKEVRNGQL